MKERPILFSAGMVRAILRPANPKTQTRRLATSPLRNLIAGDRLWVRETFATAPQGIIYRADMKSPLDVVSAPYDGGKWKPAIHMPRWASRINLMVTWVSFERLNDISRADAKAEGIEPHAIYGSQPISWKPFGSHHPPGFVFTDPLKAYRDVWETINGPGSWDQNPEVLVVEFKRITHEL